MSAQTLRTREALNQALREELRRDQSVFLLGEDIGVFNGAFKVTQGLLEEFGEERVLDTPISEGSIMGMAVGAAMAGLRPVVEMMTINFALLALDQLINSASKLHYMFGGQVEVPLTLRMPQGGGHQLGPTHSHTMEAFYAHVPGLLVAVPASPADAKGLLKSAIRDPNPVVVIEHEALYGQRGEVPDDPELLLPFGQARTVRAGSDITLIGISRMVSVCEAAAGQLAEQGVEAEVLDPRTLRPFDLPAVVDSVRRTGRLVIVEEGWPRMGVGADIAAQVQRAAFDHLDAPIERVFGADVPMPYSKPLERAAMPDPGRVVDAVQGLMRYRI